MKRSDKRWLVKWAAIWLLAAAVMALLSCESSAAAGSGEQRSATAQFREVDTSGCVETVSQVIADENQVGASQLYPDGWARYTTITVEKLDTCAGLQLLNVTGQIQTQSTDLAIDKKLAGASVADWVSVWDNISQSSGRMYVVVRWTGTGAISRNVWRTTSRTAEATLVTDGMVTLRNATVDAQLQIVK